MTREQLVALFEWQGFQDPRGHKLTSCVDFIDLVDRACGATPEVR